MESRSHFILVPGFAGFDALGALHYYEGVTDVLREARGGGARRAAVHEFANLPTAGVLTRAMALREWVYALVQQGVIRADDGACDHLHLVGHSTGGLDLRTFIEILKGEAEEGQGDHHTACEVLACMRSVQFIATPHYGTGLASQRALVTALPFIARGAYETLRATRETPLSAVARVFQPGANRVEKGWLQAIVDTVAGFDAPLPPNPTAEERLRGARARESYFSSLRWLRHMATDTTVIDDLQPQRMPAHPSSPLEECASFFRARGVAFRSYVTVAQPHPEAPAHDVFRVFHGLIASSPHPTWGSVLVPRLDDDRPMRVNPRDNDGIVSSVSMIWPSVNESVALEADHGDVMGHYVRSSLEPSSGFPARSRYDLLRSSPSFVKEDFAHLWSNVRDYAFKFERA